MTAAVDNEPDLSKLDIGDFITASRNLDHRDKTSVQLLHGKDYVQLAVTDTAANNMKIANKMSLVLNIHITKMKNGKIISQIDWPIGYGDDPLTVTNEEAASGSPDINYAVSISVALRTPDNTPVEAGAGSYIAGGNTNDNPSGGNAEIDWTPWIIAAVIIIVAAALVYYYFLRGRTVFGHKFGPKAPARPPASAAAVAAPAAPAPAPAPAPAVDGGK